MSKTKEIKGTIYHIHNSGSEGNTHGGATVMYYHAGGNIIRQVTIGDDLMQTGYYNSRNGYHYSADSCV
jgi:hypothetical protein